MSNKEHRLGVSEVNLVNRHLGLLKPVNAENLSAAIAEIDQLYGLDEIVFEQKHAELTFSYDASRLCIQCVEDILANHAVQPKQDWWTQLKIDHYRFVDQNVKENAKHEPWSCHRTPSHTGKWG